MLRKNLGRVLVVFWDDRLEAMDPLLPIISPDMGIS